MAARRQQRLVNLVLLLLSTRQYITADRIRDLVEGYEVSEESSNPDEAFKRSFERDKAELRELGVPLETGRNSAFDTEDGYRIARKDFELPPISFTADEAAAVGLAARLWSSASLATEARTALIKLRAAGVEIDAEAGADTLPPLPANEPALPDLLAAVSDKRVVQFSHRKPFADAADKRVLEPWGVLSWRGRWYVVGHDRGRGEPRSFRLDRIEGAVRTVASSAQTTRPAGLDMLEMVRGANPQPGHVGRVRVRDGRGGQLRRRAQSVSREEGQDVLEIEYRDTEWLAAMVASVGTDAFVVDPPELVKSVVSLLEAAAGGRR
ncbi:YafY family transcriptional regulator [Jatrophihabitans telluris]|uniref:YafY family transcriptional regulator n=1 Tax=Jatrophihabitans telluris TaxID=2038343 RepID=A0ABY4QRV2_9ACTN|nr:YafY family protein [Jatrophihabitans telluris]UQX86658.1 YafY family transcriptional regulator [Jatrophihabitans telluris]